MSDNFGVQASYKFGRNIQHMLNVRGSDGSELTTQLDSVDLQKVVDFGASLEAVENAGQLTQPAAPTAAPQGAAPAAPAAPAPSAPQGDGMVCKHGPRKRYDGVKKNGEPYTAYFCPTAKGHPDQCAPVWG